MKHATPFSTLSFASALCRRAAFMVFAGATVFASVLTLSANAQSPQQRPPFGSRSNNPYQVDFQMAWNAVITDPVKLIEVGPVMEDKKNNLLLLVGGSQSSDYKRKLVITHWNGTRFVTDTSNDFLGTALDALLAGRFRPQIRPVVLPAAQPPKDKKKPKPLPTSQIVTTEGVYLWNGSSFTRLFASPPNLRLALILDGTPDQMVINGGSSTTAYEAGETDSHPSAYLLDTTDAGYVRMAVGTQSYDGAKDFLPNVRYMQSYWQGRNHWQIGLERGKPAATQDYPDATTGDKLVVYIPKPANRDKSFWKMTRADDFEETWRSAALPGRVLDVRVGDPKNEGKDGILVLTAENNDKERHLYFYLPVTGRLPR